MELAPSMVREDFLVDFRERRGMIEIVKFQVLGRTTKNRWTYTGPFGGLLPPGGGPPLPRAKNSACCYRGSKAFLERVGNGASQSSDK